MLFVGNYINELVTLKSKMNDIVDMKDLGNANHVLGMHIVQNREKEVLFLSQSEYIGKVLMHFNIEGGRYGVLRFLHI